MNANPAALLDHAFQLQSQGRFAEAEKLYSQALQGIRDNPALWFNHGLVLRDLNRHAEALASFDQAQLLSPPMAEIENERAGAFTELGRHAEALAALERSLSLKPGHSGALINRGLALAAMGLPEAALADFDAVLRLEPHLPLALVNRGAALEKLGRHAEAMASYNRALAADPGNCAALNQRGLLLALEGRNREALADYDGALARDPWLAAVRFNRAMALLALGQVAEAHDEAKRVFAEQPDYPFAFDGLLDTALRSCDFATRATLETDLAAHVRGGRPLIPFNLLLCADDPALQRACAANYAAGQVGPGVTRLPPRRAASGRRLKLAYLSHDFRDHTVAVSNAAMLEKHDRARFELFAISSGPDDGSPMRQRLRQAFEHFIDVRERGDDAVAAMLAAAEIDILVDLTGHTTGGRPGILARRPAPIQVNYQGWAGTTGSDFIDYMIADTIVAPIDDGFSEKLVRLPHCYMPADPGRDPFAATMKRGDVGLPDGVFVFCAFNGIWKISPPIFRLWMELLREVAGSVLWLRHDNDAAAHNLRQEAAAAGIAPERLVFAGFAAEAEHIARHRLADLFLDTLPFTGHSTAIEALWAGLPLISCAGASFASRVSASALYSAGMPELAVPSLREYKALALKLARDPALLKSYRQHLDTGRMTFPLFDPGRLCRSLEAAYETMAERSRAGLPPEAFSVP